MGEEPGDLGTEGVGLPGVGAARVGRGADGALSEGILGRAAPRLEARAIQEAGVVEPLGQAPDLLDGRRLTVAAADDLLDRLQRMLAVEQRDQIEERPGQDRDLVGEAGGIPQGDAALPLVLDREGLDSPQAWIAG